MVIGTIDSSGAVPTHAYCLHLGESTPTDVTAVTAVTRRGTRVERSTFFRSTGKHITPTFYSQNVNMYKTTRGHHVTAGLQFALEVGRVLGTD
jgi:hypothetical protein